MSEKERRNTNDYLSGSSTCDYGYEDKIHKTIEFDSFAEACMAAGELKLLYVQETIYEIGINKITFSDGKTTVEYSTIVKMNEPTEKATRDWTRKNPNYSKMLHDIRDAWVNLHDLHENHSNHLYGIDTLDKEVY